MAKEWILNSVLNRFQLNFKRNVGFIFFSIKDGKNKKIYNTDIIDEIKKEIDRLSK